jgi:virulence factor Mce-like protein
VSDLMARISAVASVALGVVALVVLVVTSNPGLRGGAEVHAVFEDAYPLLEGMHVRVDGAVAGSVKRIELNEDGNAAVTLQLFEGTEPPRQGAVATIRQEDITGDSYVSLSPGAASAPLGADPIPPRRTMVAPRFDDLLNSFDEPVRQGLELLFVQLGRTLEARGEDVNRAALELRPALAAANRALAEVGSQNQALKALIADAERVTGQAAQRSDELGGLVESLAEVTATTAAHAPALDSALEAAPETVPLATETLTDLSRLADAAKPLAVALGEAAPELAESSMLLGPFLDDAEAVLDDVDPTLELTVELLRASVPTLRANPKRVFTAPFDLTAGIGGLLDSLLGDPVLLKSLFSADTYGGMVPGDASDDVGLGAIGVELGTQIGYPADYDPERRFVRAVAVPSCESLGAPIERGCLLDVLTGLLPLPGSLAAGRQRGGDDGGRPPSGSSSPAIGNGEDSTAGGARERLRRVLDRVGLGDGGGGSHDDPSTDQIDSLLGFLLGP